MEGYTLRPTSGGSITSSKRPVSYATQQRSRLLIVRLGWSPVGAISAMVAWQFCGGEHERLCQTPTTGRRYAWGILSVLQTARVTLPTLPGMWCLAPHATRELCGMRFVPLEL